MNRNDMLRSRVSELLTAHGMDSTQETVTTAITGVREELAQSIDILAMTFSACPNVGCGCDVAAAVYGDAALTVRELIA